MVRRVMEHFECDRCGRPGQRYTIVFTDGSLALDRCETHGKKMEALRDEPGEWIDPHASTPKRTFKKSTIADLRLAMAERGSDGDSNGKAQ